MTESPAKRESHFDLAGTDKLLNDRDWWRQACVYQVYPRSFADGNGDGIGDLHGLIERIPYLIELGVDAVWLSPFYPSALRDGGYDVVDYCDVDPKIGTLDDFRMLAKVCNECGMKIIVDIVPNHCSNDHPWFLEALKAGKGSHARDRFCFLDGKGDDGSMPPTDWTAGFGGSAWTSVGDGQFYLGIFSPFQPDWNRNNQDVRDEFLRILRFWGDMGVAGFRVDVAHGLAKDLSVPLLDQATIDQLLLRQEGESAGASHPFWDRDEVFRIYAAWRAVFEEYDPPLCAVAEAWVEPSRKPLYASAKGLGQTFSFDLLLREYDRNQFKICIDECIRIAKQSGTTTTWVLSNHDVVRHTSRYGLPTTGRGNCQMDFLEAGEKFLKTGLDTPGFNELDGTRRAKAATLLMLALPGSAYLYQGEELGLSEVLNIPPECRQDPIFLRSNGTKTGRDGCRVPLPWNKVGTSFGFGQGDAAHLPQPDWMGKLSIESQHNDPNSTLNLYRRALELRRLLQSDDHMTWVTSRPDCLHFKRTNGWEVIVNFGCEEMSIREGALLLASDALVDGRVPKDVTVWLRPDDV